MRKILISCGFAIGGLILIGAFMTATTYAQLAVAVFIYPVLVYFGFKAFPRGSWSYASGARDDVIPLAAAQSEEKFEEKFETDKEEPTVAQKISAGIADIDKRAFLKLLGGAGISFFILSLFNKKTDGLFSRNLPSGVAGTVTIQDPNNKKIDPAQNQPTDGYKIAEIEDNDVAFYGYTNKDGAWFVMKIDTETGSIRYSKGESNFPGGWGNREGLTYDYYNNVF